MIQQRIGDLLEIDEGGKYFYVVVLSKVVMFGGNILFASHNEGQRREVGSLTSDTNCQLDMQPAQCAEFLGCRARRGQKLSIPLVRG